MVKNKSQRKKKSKKIQRRVAKRRSNKIKEQAALNPQIINMIQKGPRLANLNLG